MAEPASGGSDDQRAVTRADVASRAGVSTAVVSYVLNDGPRPVAAATRERVLAAMAALDYRPNAAARALRLQRAEAIGLVVPDVSNTYFGALARSITQQAFDAGYAVLLGDADNDPRREQAQIESLVGRQVDGLIVVSLDPTSNARTGEIPTVYLDRRSRRGQRSILVDNAGGAAAAVDHLVKHGCRRIAHLGGPVGAPGSDERHAGWLSAVTRHGLPVEDALAVREAFSRAGGLAAGRRLLAATVRPDAVFVSSDAQALGLLRAAREVSVAVPHDLRVISFDGTEDAVYSDPPLTAVEQPVGAMAAAALSAVLDPKRFRRRAIPVSLVLRDSCGPH